MTTLLALTTGPDTCRETLALEYDRDGAAPFRVVSYPGELIYGAHTTLHAAVDQFNAVVASLAPTPTYEVSNGNTLH